MDLKFLLDSFVAFNLNAVNRIAYSFSTNWWLIVFVVAIVICVILGVKEESQTVYREEQNIL